MARATIKDKKDVLSNCEPNNVRTSRIKIDPQKEGYGVLKLKVIEQDFDVFALTYQGKAEYQSERNASYVKALGILNENHPVSISYLYGQRAILVFQKGKVSGTELKKKLYEADPDTGLKLVQVDIRADGDRGNEAVLGKHNEHLTHAICNMLANTNNNYSSMDGHLYYTTSELSVVYNTELQLHRRKALEVSINDDILALKVRTFTEYEKKMALSLRVNKRTHIKKPLYTVDTTTGKMRRVRVEDIEDTAYLMMNAKGKKSVVDFCSWKSLEISAKTKMGILYRSFLPEVEEKLSKYIHLEFDTPEFYQLKKVNLKCLNEDQRTLRYAELLKAVGIHKFYVCNLIFTRGVKASAEFAEYLKKYGFEVEECMEEPYIDDGEFAIIIIHGKKDYTTKLGIEDAYTSPDYCTQHYVVPLEEKNKEGDEEEEEGKKRRKSKKATTDDTEETDTQLIKQNVFLKLLAEAIIKTDLKEKYISLTDLAAFMPDCENEDFMMKVCWITRRRKGKDDSDDTDNTEKFEYWYPQLVLYSDGTINNVLSIGDSADAKKILLAVQKEEEAHGRVMQYIITIGEHTYAISRTEEVFLPSESLNTQLVEDATGFLDTKKYREYLKEFYEQTQCDAYYEAALEKADLFDRKNGKHKYNKGDLRSLCCIKGYEKTEGKAMRNFLSEKGVNTVSHLKDQNSKKANGLGAFEYAHFRMIEEPSPLNSNFTDPVLQYVVGELRLNQSLTRALHVYTIRCIKDNLDDMSVIREEMLNIFRMTDVFFVRENQFTVVPFICKYAREWERIEYYKEHFKGSDDDTDDDDETIDLSNEPDEEGESVF